MSFVTRNKNHSILKIEQPKYGFDILCFGCFMYAAVKETEFISVEKQNAQIGKFELTPNKSNVVQIGNGGAAGCFTTIKMMPPFSLLYLGIFPNAQINEHKTKLLVFQQLEADQPRQFPRNLFGIEGCDEYQNFLVCLFYMENFISMTTRFNASRIYKEFIKFAE